MTGVQTCALPIYHIYESIFKALGKALDEATGIDVRHSRAIPSTKGIL